MREQEIEVIVRDAESHAVQSRLIITRPTKEDIEDIGDMVVCRKTYVIQLSELIH
jgi:hypothetical protein